MNADITLVKVNELYMRVLAEKSVLLELESFFSFYVEGYKYMEKWKSGIWDGKIRLFKLSTSMIYSSLRENILKFCQAQGYSCDVDPSLDPIKHLPEVREFVKQLPEISILEPYPYQISAFVGAIVENKSLILSPTASGKSLIFYMIVQFLLQHLEDKILLVVPTVSLVEQGVKDMISYDLTGNIEDMCHKIHSGKSKDSDRRVFVTTWQSVYKMPKEWFDKFGAVIIDEAHQADSSSLTGIIEKMPNALFRVGLTGTLSGAKTQELFMRGIFGKVIKTTTTKQLMDQGLLSTLFVRILHIKYPKADCKVISKLDYKDEISFLNQHEKRNDLLMDLSLSQEGNVLLLFNFIENHGEKLFEKAEKVALDKGKLLYFVSGGTHVEERERIRELVEQHDNLVIYASYGVFSTGINMKNLRTVIFAHPFKSIIRNLQSIGRGLRLAEGKNIAVLIDFCDDLTYGKRHNFAYTHAIERMKLYENQEFEYKLENVVFE